MFSRGLHVMFLLLLAFSQVVFMSQGMARAAVGLETKAKHAFIMDFETGDVLFEKEADAHMPTSSMSKVMTIYLVFEALKKGSLSLDDTFLVSEKAWRMGGSKMFVPVGKQVRIEDLIRGVLVQSGNDATIVLAEGLAGSEEAFAMALNNKAQELGMKNSHFMNASGWPHDEHYSTAHDLAILARKIISEFPEYYHYFSELEFTFSEIKQGNRNPLLYRNIGADGLKTGHTEVGGYGLMGSGVKDDRRVIVVLNGMASMQERADESARLLQWALNGFKNITLFAQNDVIEEVPVYFGHAKTVGLIAQEPLSVTVPSLYEDGVNIDMTYMNAAEAPIKMGDQMGAIKVTVPGRDKAYEVALIADRDIEEQGFFMKTLSKLYLLATGKGAAR